VSTWPETATSIAVRLLANDELHVVAPCGLADLFGMVLRRNPRTVKSFRPLATWTSREYGHFFAYQVIPAIVKDPAHLEFLPML
jgi:hypothetical protein